jgi:type II restriction enzyme
MARKEQLRKQRTGTVINLTAKKQQSVLGRALKKLIERLQQRFPQVNFDHKTEWRLKDIVASLREIYPDVKFHYHHDTSSMKPDGGILSIVDKSGKTYPILIVEVKDQGTNQLRLREGLPPQARGNAIERLGKNVIGFRTALMHECIFPFVCFGDGCDFAEGSSILDRVITIAMFGELNVVHLFNEGPYGRFNRGTFLFRENPWKEDEMVEVMYEIACRSVHYYFAKYGEEAFVSQSV